MYQFYDNERKHIAPLTHGPAVSNDEQSEQLFVIYIKKQETWDRCNLMAAMLATLHACSFDLQRGLCDS